MGKSRQVFKKTQQDCEAMNTLSSVFFLQVSPLHRSLLRCHRPAGGCREHRRTAVLGWGTEASFLQGDLSLLTGRRTEKTQEHGRTWPPPGGHTSCLSRAHILALTGTPAGLDGDGGRGPAREHGVLLPWGHGGAHFPAPLPLALANGM